MGTYHLNALRQLAAGEIEDYYKGDINYQLRKIRVCGICDNNPIHLKSFDGLKSFDNLQYLIKKCKPHIIIIATPTNTHKDFALEALNYGIHTFVEKPIVTELSQFEQLKSLADEKGCRLMAGHVERYNPVSIKIISLLKNASPATDSYAFKRTQKHDVRITDDILIDKVIHDLDLSQYFFDEIRDFKINNFKLVDGRVYEISLCLEHENGVKGNLFVSWLDEQQTKKRLVEIHQGGHIWKGNFVSKQLWVDDAEIKCQVDGMINPSNNQIKDELVDFISFCIDEDSVKKITPLLSLEEISQSIKWLEKINLKIYRDLIPSNDTDRDCLK